MAFPASRAIDTLGVAHVQRLEDTLQPTGAGRDCNQVDVVGHQAVGEHVNVEEVAVLPQPGQIGDTVFVTEEDVLAPIAALRNVVWDAAEDTSSSNPSTQEIPQVGCSE